MKTIFIMFSRGIVARNILRTDVFSILKASGHRLVLFVPRNIPDTFREECAHPNVVLEETDDIDYGVVRRKLIDPLFKNLVYTATSRFMNRYTGRIRRKRHQFLTYLVLHIFYSGISRLSFLKPIARTLDYFIFRDKYFDHFFRKYNPDLVVVTTVMSKRDIALMKGARRHRVRSIGITRGWDNLDRLFMICAPDHLIVQNELMKERAVRLDALKPERVFVSGLPQFDLYLDKSIYEPRDAFLKKLGLDPSRSVIMFGSEGQWAPYDEPMVRLICQWIERNELARPCSLIIRPHFSDVYEHRFDEFKGTPHVYLEEEYRMEKFFTDMWNPTREEMVKLANQFAHMDVLVTFISTIVIEAAIHDKPVINVDFYTGNEPDQGPYFGRWYGASHYQDILNSGGVRLAQSEKQLKELINVYLERPETDREGRRELVRRMCYRMDGKGGERIAKFILERLDSVPAPR